MNSPGLSSQTPGSLARTTSRLRKTNSGQAGSAERELAAAQVQALFRHPGWALLQHYLSVRRKLGMDQALRLDPLANQVELARYQGEVRLIDKLLTPSAEESGRLAGTLVDNLERAV